MLVAQVDFVISASICPYLLACDLTPNLLNIISDDRVGNISTRHLQIADQSSSGSFDEDCLVLAKLASQAVDFAKSGVPVRHQDIPRARSSMRPDFLVTASDNIERDTYPSMKALGKLFRAVPVRSITTFSCAIASLSFTS